MLAFGIKVKLIKFQRLIFIEELTSSGSYAKILLHKLSTFLNLEMAQEMLSIQAPIYMSSAP
jgi:hypothetical protein